MSLKEIKKEIPATEADVRQLQGTDLKASLQLAKYAETQAAYEKMDAHRYAATIRLENLKD